MPDYPPMLVVYIASAYTIGDPVANVNRQLDAADRLIDLGYCPMIPLLSHYQHIRHERDWRVWMQQSIEKLRRCDALLRLPGESKGANIEEELARQWLMPVAYSVEQLHTILKNPEAAQ